MVEDIATKAMAVLSNLRNRERLCSEMIRVAATQLQAIERAIAGSISRLGTYPVQYAYNQSHRYWIDIMTCGNTAIQLCI